MTESAVLYCFRCLGPPDMPSSAGAFAPLDIRIPAGSLLSPYPPAAVAGGNVETAQRVVDVVFGALAQALPDRIPAASAGTMNNWTFGGIAQNGVSFAYYETLGGGMGARPTLPGLGGVQVHMTNTLNTPVEALERQFPLVVRRYGLRRGSGGTGRVRGGDGLVREIEFRAPVTVSLLTERRVYAPTGCMAVLPACGDATFCCATVRSARFPARPPSTCNPATSCASKRPAAAALARHRLQVRSAV